MNKKYFIFYFLSIVVFSLLVLLKQNTITKKNKKEAISFYSAWKAEGKPVVVQAVQKSDMDSSLKTTLIFESDNIYIGLLPRGFIRWMSIESPVFIKFKDKKIPCKILEIGTVWQLDTGMYLVKIFCPEKLAQANEKYLAEVMIPGLKNVVILPHDSINMENDRSFVWVIKEGKAHKQFITLAERNCKGVVAKGIDEKDLVIVRGSAGIQENDPVKLNYEN